MIALPAVLLNQLSEARASLAECRHQLSQAATTATGEHKAELVEKARELAELEHAIGAVVGGGRG